MLRFAKGLVKFHPPNFPKFFCTKEVWDFSRRETQYQLTERQVSCLVLHPVLFPNKGPVKELYLAEEAIGLAKALDWKVVKGPYWKEPEESQELGQDSQEEEYDESQGKAKMQPKEGEYVVTPVFKGTYHVRNQNNQDQLTVDKKGGIVLDLDSTDEEGDDLYDEWKNELLRTSIAKSSLIKVKQTNKASFFGKGKVVELGEFIRDNDINAVFINNELSSLQVRTLEAIVLLLLRRWTKIINFEDDSPESNQIKKEQESEEDTENENEEGETESKRKVKVFDRFTIILQIFAKRAQTRIAKLQIELAFLNFQKAKLTREGTTFTGYNIFSGDLMSANETKLEVVSSKQRGALGKVSGEGETQLEIERRVLSDKEAKIKRELMNENNSRQWLRTKRKSSAISTVPTIALIGYTNAGKSALMNKLTKAGVESENKLFQTLSTTSKKLKLRSGQMGILLDTIGFITNLPHDLIESFKCTLEEVQDADIVLHVRDISHPNTEDQKQTVLEVLKELKFDESFYNKRMVEVWNKIDLVEEPIDYKAAAQSDTPVVPISALYGTNCEKLIEVVTNKVNDIMGKKLYTFIHSPDHHTDRLNWLYKNGNIANVENFNYDDRKAEGFPYGKITFQVYLDDVTYRRYQATFGEKGGQKEREKIPDDWIKSSKSFFERRKEEQERQKKLEEMKSSKPNKEIK